MEVLVGVRGFTINIKSDECGLHYHLETKFFHFSSFKVVHLCQTA